MDGIKWIDGSGKEEAKELQFDDLTESSGSLIWVKRLLEEVFTRLNIEEGELKATKREGRVTAQWQRAATR